ncbi:MAG: thioredoxin family protein [Coriobacteriia bacterium]
MKEVLMEIKILGTGCPNCQRLEANTREAVQRLGLEATFEKVTDPMEIVDYGIMSTPGLVVDGEVKVAGRVPDVDEIAGMLGG